MNQRKIQSNLKKGSWIPGLLSRVTLATAFLVSGIGKFQHLGKDAEFFRSLKIPAPELMAPVVASFEVGCGALIGLGFQTRAASLPLMSIMAVAIATARRNEFHSFSELTGIYEFSYLLLLGYLLTEGPGAVSVDSFLARRENRVQHIARDTGMRDIQDKTHRAG